MAKAEDGGASEPDPDAGGGPTGKLTAEKLAEVHPYIPDAWARSMGEIIQRGGPWGCGICGGPSYLEYRCSQCGNDLL